MSLAVHIYVKVDTLFIRLNGELDHHTSGQLRDRIISIVNDYNIKNIVFNMKNLSFMDSSGIGIILGRYNQLKRSGGVIVVCDLNTTIERIITLSGLNKIITITKDEQMAKSFLGVA